MFRSLQVFVCLKLSGRDAFNILVEFAPLRIKGIVKFMSGGNVKEIGVD